jgi:hypothetical protein
MSSFYIFFEDDELEKMDATEVLVYLLELYGFEVGVYV